METGRLPGHTRHWLVGLAGGQGLKNLVSWLPLSVQTGWLPGHVRHWLVGLAGARWSKDRIRNQVFQWRLGDRPVTFAIGWSEFRVRGGPKTWFLEGERWEQPGRREKAKR